MSKKCQPCEPVVLYCEPPVVKVHKRMELFNTRQCMQCSQIDNGVDPVLGPPYAPILYQAFGNSGQPRITRTVPMLTILGAVTGGGTTATITASNYASLPASTSLKLYGRNSNGADAGYIALGYKFYWTLLADSDAGSGQVPGYDLPSIAESDMQVAWDSLNTSTDQYLLTAFVGVAFTGGTPTTYTLSPPSYNQGPSGGSMDIGGHIYFLNGTDPVTARMQKKNGGTWTYADTQPRFSLVYSASASPQDRIFQYYLTATYGSVVLTSPIVQVTLHL